MKRGMHGRILALACLTCALAQAAVAQDKVTVNLGAVSAPVDSVVGMPINITPEGTGAASLVLNLDFDNSNISLAGVNLESTVSAAGKALEHRVTGGKLSLSVFGGVNTLPAGKIATLYWNLSDAVSGGATVNITGAASSAASPAATPVEIVYEGGAISVTAATGHHNADYNPDWTIQLSELLRIIQFFNSDALHCDPSTEDGYRPGTGDTTCGNHNSDYNLPDWKINLSELLRMIQIYNAIGSAYHPDAAGEDGFAPGPF